MTDEMFKPEWRPHPVLQTPHLAFFPLTVQKSRMVEGYGCYRGKDRTGTSILQPRECHHWVTSCDEVFDTQGFSISGCSSSTELLPTLLLTSFSADEFATYFLQKVEAVRHSLTFRFQIYPLFLPSFLLLRRTKGPCSHRPAPPVFLDPLSHLDDFIHAFISSLSHYQFVTMGSLLLD